MGLAVMGVIGVKVEVDVLEIFIKTGLSIGVIDGGIGVGVDDSQSSDFDSIADHVKAAIVSGEISINEVDDNVHEIEIRARISTREANCRYCLFIMPPINDPIIYNQYRQNTYCSQVAIEDFIDD